MKKMMYVVIALLSASGLYAQTWNLDKAHANVGFTISHLVVSDVDGYFTSFDGKVTSAKDDFSDAKVEMSAQTASINTQNEKRDEHLKGADFFDAEKFPTITFVSKSVKKGKGKDLIVTGDLTMHGVTKSITLTAVIKGTSTDPFSKKPLVGFKVTGMFKRSDFGIGSSTPAAMVGDEVNLIANLAFVKG